MYAARLNILAGHAAASGLDAMLPNTSQQAGSQQSGAGEVAHLMRHKDALLFPTPGVSVDLGVELVMPSLPTLLADAAREEG